MNIQFTKSIVLRTPCLPCEGSMTRQYLIKLWQDPVIKKGIYLASRSLYSELDSYFGAGPNLLGEPKNLLQSLYKYASRMSHRATPFGFFAGCAAVHWAEKTELILSGRYRIYTLPDASVSFGLSKVSEHLSGNDAGYVLNNTIYKLAGEYRFITFKLSGGSRIYEVSAIDYHKVLEDVCLFFNDKVKTKSETLEYFASYHASAFPAFLDELISSQFLKYAYDPKITVKFPHFLPKSGVDYFDRDCESLARLIKSDRGISGETEDWLAFYKVSAELMRKLTRKEHQNYHYINRSNELISAALDKKLQRQIQNGITLLHNINDSRPNSDLVNFKNNFLKRFDKKSVPLLEAFDVDTGISYGSGTISKSIFTRDLEEPSMSPPNPKMPGAFDRKFFTVLSKANDEKEYTYIIPKDIAPERSADVLPFSLAVMLQLFEDDTLYLEKVTGPGALSMLARFATADHEICEIGLELSKKEIQSNTDVIFAEIIHIPEERILNVMAHPTFWDFELLYLDTGQSAQTIMLSDLDIIMDNGDLKLYSKRYQKQVIPRLSSAYNYRRSQHPIFTFLCDIQHQSGHSALAFHWGSLAKDFTFYPRVVTSDGIILHRATWKFSTTLLEPLRKVSKDLNAFIKAFEEIKSFWKLPDQFFLVFGDNELFLEWSNPICVDILLKDITHQQSPLILCECLHSEFRSVVSNAQNERYAHQLIAPVYFSGKGQLVKKPFQFKTEKRRFLPGSEWLYIKLYLNKSIANEVLLVIDGYMEQSAIKKLSDSWFFVRYQDPDHHLRLRFKLNDNRYFQEFYLGLLSVIDVYVETGRIFTVQLDTYEREVERYTGQVAKAEHLFCLDTAFCCVMFKEATSAGFQETDWIMIICHIRNYLFLLSVDPEEQLAFVEKQYVYFLAEFPGKAIKVKIDQLYREHRQLYDNLARDYQILLQEREINFSLVSIQQNILWSDQLLGSVIHMAINRFFSEQPRLHECIIYGLIFRALKSESARRTKSLPE